MNQTDLIAHVAESTGITKIAATTTLETVLSDIAASLRKSEDVYVHGFGTFSATAYPERTGCNPRTGAEISIPASKAPKFKAAKRLKDAVGG